MAHCMCCPSVLLKLLPWPEQRTVCCACMPARRSRLVAADLSFHSISPLPRLAATSNKRTRNGCSKEPDRQRATKHANERGPALMHKDRHRERHRHRHRHRHPPTHPRTQTERQTNRQSRRQRQRQRQRQTQAHRDRIPSVWCDSLLASWAYGVLRDDPTGKT